MNVELIIQLLYVHLWQGLLLVPAIWVITRLLIKQNATLRHGLWFSALCLMTFLPLTTYIDLPRLTTEWFQMDVANETAKSVSYTKITETAMVSPEKISLTTPYVSSNTTSNDLVIYILLFIWFGGFCVKFSNIVRELIYNLKFKAKLKPIAREFLPNNWSTENNVYLDDNIITPMMVGFARPRILIPSHFTKNLSREQIISILYHELAHIERRDQWTSLIQQFLLSIMWWSPFAHVATKRILIDRELACDDIAAYRSGSANSYATALIEGSKQVVMSKTIMVEPQLALGIFHRPSEFKERINRLLKADYSQGYIMKKHFSALTVTIIIVSVFAISFATPGVSSDRKNTIKDPLNFEITTNPFQRSFVEASGEASPEELDKFLKAGAEINKPTLGDGTALMMAVRSEKMDNVEFLLSKGADVNIPSRGDGNPLIVASGKNNIPLINRLIEAGADVNAIVPNDETPLITAIRYQNFTAIRALTEAGADVSLGAIAPGQGFMKRDICRTPLGEARLKRNRQIIEYLEEHGAQILDCAT